MSKTKKAILFLIISNIIWGASPPVSKWALTNIPLFTLAFLRFFIPAIIMGLVFHRHLKIQKRDIFPLFIATTFLITINIAFFFLGVRKTASINAAIIGSSGPLFLMWGAFLFLKESIRRKMMYGNLIGFLGILIIVFQPLISSSPNLSIIGNMYLILSTLGSVIGTIMMKKLMKRNLPGAVVFWSSTIAAVSLSPLFFQEVQQKGFLPHLQTSGIIGLIFSIFLASITAYYLYFYALKFASASESGMFTYIDPIVTILVAIPLLHEYPTPLFFLGSALVFAGIFLAEGHIPYHPVHKLLPKQ